MIPVILSGGSGTRLWPLSRKEHPKQFLKLGNDKFTMLQETLNRVNMLQNIKEPIIIGNYSHRFLIAEQLRELGIDKRSILLEPMGKNTAPAIALAAMRLLKEGNDDVMLVLPSDHQILDIEKFQASVSKAYKFAKKDKLVTFGIVAKSPQTGFGYIKRGEILAEETYEVDGFVEKPTLEVAKEYVKSKEYYWNSGMFMFKPSVYIEELKKFRNDIFLACEDTLKNLYEDFEFIRIDKESFSKVPDESIDYAVMEKTSKSVVVSMDAKWSDVGSWSALWEVLPKDEHKNATTGDTILYDTTSSLVYSSDKLIVTLGIDDIVVVNTPDVVLVSKKDRVQDVKKVVEILKGKNRREIKEHLKVYRPWGHFNSIESDARHKVKHITVLPGEKLSIQKHYNRAEHWVVVRGTAKVTLDDKEIIVTENESVYIPLGSIHALENPGKIDLEMIEVQVGSYLGEDDIIRLSDKYGR